MIIAHATLFLLLMISYDVSNLFTNVPLNETIDIAVKILLDNEPNIGITNSELKTLFRFATSKTHFLFNDEVFDQVDGVAMGSPLGPVLANIFMGYHEKRWLENYKGSKPEVYTRYVDDIFCVFKNEQEALLFFDYLNDQHINISFTCEKEINGTLPFLDVLIKNINTKTFETSVYRKKTFTGLLTNYLSFLPFVYKLALMKTLINRIFHICSSEKMFNENIKELKTILSKNMFPPKLIDQTIKRYLNDKTNKDVENNDKTDNETFFKLPYVGEYSTYVCRKIKGLCKKYCKTTEIKISFSMCKTGDLFSIKSSIPRYLKSFVVYYFECASCGASYIGETTRYLDTRIHEHLEKSSSPSTIFNHLQKNEACKKACNASCLVLK